jgi:hypothetical protein
MGGRGLFRSVFECFADGEELHVGSPQLHKATTVSSYINPDSIPASPREMSTIGVGLDLETPSNLSQIVCLP